MLAWMVCGVLFGYHYWPKLHCERHLMEERKEETIIICGGSIHHSSTASVAGRGHRCSLGGSS